MTLHIIPDVHGCIEESKSLVATLNIKDGDEVISLGDLINKGPHSAEVVKFFRELSERVKFTLIMGNHEENFLKWLARPVEKRLPMRLHETFDALNNELEEADRDFLRSSVLFKNFTVGGREFFAVHGGIPFPLMEREELPTLEEVAKLLLQ